MGDMKPFLQGVYNTARTIAGGYSYGRIPSEETTQDRFTGFQCSGTLQEMADRVRNMFPVYAGKDEDEGTVTFDYTSSVMHPDKTMMYTARVKLSKEEDGQWKASFSYGKRELVPIWKTLDNGLSNEALNSFVQFNL
jgi:hypothetical protein